MIGAIILFQVLRAAAPFTFGAMSFVATSPTQDFPYFVGTQHGYTRADLEQLAGSESPGDRLLRDFLRDGHRHVYLEDSDAMEVCLEPPKGRQLRIATTGWPVHWRNENTDRHTDDVFRDQASLGAEIGVADAWQTSSPSSWQSLVVSRTAGDTSQRLLLNRTPRVALAIAAVSLALGLAAIGRLLLRPRSRRARAGLWIASLLFASAAAAGFSWWAHGAREDRLVVIPQDAVARPFVATGLTAATLRGMLGAPDADARLAATLLATLPPSTAPTDVLLARRVVAAPYQSHVVEIGWPQRMVYFTRSWKPDPAGSGRLALEPEPGRFMPQGGSIAWVLPHGPDAKSAIFAAFEIGEVALWIVRLVVAFWAVRVAIRLTLRIRRRRRTARNLCLACGYDLSGSRTELAA